MLRITTLVVMLASVAHADEHPKATIGIGVDHRTLATESAFHVDLPITGLYLAGALHVSSWQTIDAQIGIARTRVTDGGSVITADDEWNMQIGSSALRWYAPAAVGVRASVGYQRMRVTFVEGVVDDGQPSLENYDAVYAEAALLLRLRLAPRVAVDALVGLRASHFQHHDELGLGTVAAVGVHATL